MRHWFGNENKTFCNSVTQPNYPNLLQLSTVKVGLADITTTGLAL